MGLLDKIFGKKEDSPAVPEVIDIKLEDLSGLLEERREAVHHEIIEEIESLVEEMMDARDEVQEIIEVLRDKDFPEEIRDRVPKPVKTAKPKYIKAMGDAVKGIRVDKEGIDGYRSFQIKTMKTLKNIQKTQVGQGRFVAHSFEQDVLRIGGNLNKLIDAGGKLGEALLRDDGNRESFREGERIADSIKEMSSRSRQGGEIIEEHRDEIEILKAKIQKAEKTIEDMKTSDGYSDLKAMYDEMASAKDERGAVRGEVFRKISPLGRVLRKYRKLLEGTPEGKAIDGYLKNPSAAFIEGVALTPILIGLEKAMSGGHISLKDKEMTKMQQRLKDALTTDFDDLEKSYKDAVQNADSIQTKIKKNKVAREIEAQEVEIDEMGARIEKMEDEIRSKEKDQPTLEGKVEDNRKSLEGLLEDILGADVKLTL